LRLESGGSDINLSLTADADYPPATFVSCFVFGPPRAIDKKEHPYYSIHPGPIQHLAIGLAE